MNKVVDRSLLHKIADRLALFGNVLVLAYLTVFTVAQPSPALVTATAFELVFFVALVLYRNWRSRTKSVQQVEEALKVLDDSSSFIRESRRIFSLSVIALASLACLFAAVDLTALCLANAGFYPQAKAIYCAMTPPAILNIHPAFSLEVLTGACIEAGKYEKAEKLEELIFAIRIEAVGEKDELIAADYANLGDFYRRWNKQDKAESFYRKAIDLSREIHVKRGWGSPMTKLASLLRDEGRCAESDVAFQSALAIRSKLFGGHSEKVGETLAEYSSLLDKVGKHEEAESARAQAKEIQKRAANESFGKEFATVFSIVILILSCIVAMQRDKLLIALAKYFKGKAKPSKIKSS